MKIIHITDTHLAPPGAQIWGLDQADRLARVVADIVARHPDADLVALTGDLAHAGEPAAYAELERLLRPLPMPVRMTLGNHDSRANFLAAFPDAPRDGEGHVQHFHDTPGLRLVFADTHEPGWSGGRLCAKRLDWLDSALAEAPGEAIVFLHHPPSKLGVRHFEAITLDAPGLGDVLRRHRDKVRLLVFSHMHLPISGLLFGRIPFVVGRGAAHQMAVEFDAKDCVWTDASPSYGVLMASPQETLYHTVDLFDEPKTGVGAYPPGP